MFSVKNLSKTFNNNEVVKNVSLELKKGEIVALLGHNGAGKTTTIKMMASLLKPTDGTILIDGKNLSKHTLDTKKEIGYVAQDSERSMYARLTAFENLY